jgi:hypothetical protein
MSDETEDATTETTEDVEEQEAVDGEENLADAGKKALDTMKGERNAAKREARELKQRLADLEAKLGSAGKPPEEQALETARAEARKEATTAANKRIVRANVLAAAKGKLADPADALAAINLDDFDVSDDGEVDPQALDDAITELLDRKPHWGVSAERRFTGAADQGARGKQAAKEAPSINDLLRAAANNS